MPPQSALAHISPPKSGIGCDKTEGIQQEQSNMNKNQAKGTAKDVAGKIQEEAGKLVGSKEQQIKGLSKQISGKMQKGIGDVEQSVEELDKR
jgi:uncharacterized protein YjbJ (UPF0337 family)